MTRGDIIILLDGQKVQVVRGLESGLSDVFVVVLENGFIRLTDTQGKTLLYSFGEIISKKC